ncbi:MAG: bifunctional hydroxymethylpyrimidine kinase/phosphomethylpyrimidine kinase [Verrucomicrobiae bacterium]|nr:bifunctional hydroxymethylpyrimidine kinase/phosphomethylpyrimidine kinase [Verrucomicrobiae bacterium]
MAKRAQLAVALTIAGSDSGGGAGIQADLKTFQALGVHGTSALTCITAQNPNGLRSVQPVQPKIVTDQIEMVFEAFPVKAVKTGMLYSSSIIRSVAKCLRSRPGLVVVVDPVMVATSGAALLKPTAVAALEESLLPMATLVTPNVPEAEVLSGLRIREVEDLRRAVRVIRDKYGCAALAKGGHLSNLKEAVDIFWDGRTELLLKAGLVGGIATHGTGCTYSAAIAAWVARGCDLTAAVVRAKEYITSAIANSARAGNHDVLSWLFF